MTNYRLASELLRIGMPFIIKYINSLAKRHNPSRNDESMLFINCRSESGVRHQRYKTAQTHDTLVQKMYEECNKALEALERHDSELALFHIRKVMENILVFAIQANQLDPKDSFKSATNLRICKKNGLMDLASIESIDVCRSVCGDNTHQLGYDDSLSEEIAKDIVYRICDALDYVINRYQPVYQA